MEYLKERQLKRLNERLNKLQNDLGNAITSGNDVDTLVQEIKTLETEKKNLDKKRKLDSVNKKHTERRNFLSEALSIKFPEEDIIVSGGSLHATKVKKYKSLHQFITKHKYATFEFENGSYTVIKNGGERYTLKKPEHKYNEPTKHLNFETVEDALKWNGIMLKPLTFKKFISVEAKILKESERMRKEIEKSNEKLKSLDVHFYNYNDLIRRYDSRSHYEYRSI